MTSPCYHFGEFELDRDRFELRRNGRTLKLERIPMELLILLLERQGSVVTRQEIVDRLWGKDVFVDTEHGINTVIRPDGGERRNAQVSRSRLPRAYALSDHYSERARLRLPPY